MNTFLVDLNKIIMKHLKIIVSLALIAIIVISIYFLKTEKSAANPLCKGSRKCFEANMTRIIDGDTFVIGYSRVRLALVDTPRLNETGYNEAIEFIKNLCPVGSTAVVDQDDLQPYSYDRIIAVVYCNNKNLNEELLRGNLAVMEREFCLKSEFANDTWAKEYGC